VLHYLSSKGLEIRVAAGAGREDLYFLVESRGSPERREKDQMPERKAGLGAGKQGS
jgi:hypothetical protein